MSNETNTHDTPARLSDAEIADMQHRLEMSDSDYAEDWHIYPDDMRDMLADRAALIADLKAAEAQLAAMRPL
ncbi:MAG TPA: hypothetical protein VKQ36_09925, partial [Ktedonobacterales bacterium]|nr:hypothetical protein [Ktedonobacterales bacterium]